MKAGTEGMMLVRAELCERLDALQSLSRRVSVRDFTVYVDGIRTLAATYGLIPVVRLAEALERAVSENGRDCPRALYLGRLRDAIGCERLDEQASEALLASICVRLA